MTTVAAIAIKGCLGMLTFWAGALCVVRAASAEAAPLGIVENVNLLSTGDAACPDAVSLCDAQAGGSDAQCAARCESTHHKAGVCQSFDQRTVECWCTNDQKRWGLVSPVCSN